MRRALVALLAAALTCACTSAPPAAPQAPASPEPAADAGAVDGLPAEPGLISEEAFKAAHVLREGAAPTLHGETLTLPGGSTAYLSLPQGVEGPVPGVIVIHEWWGLNDNIKHWADRLADEGYAALAVDLYGGQVATTSDQAMALVKGVDNDAALAVLHDGHSFLQQDPRVLAPRTASLGWCFGGGWSLRMAIEAPDLDAAVLYYGRLVDDPEQLSRIQAPLLGLFGDKDKGIPRESVQAFHDAAKAQGKAVTVHMFHADHAFANPSSGRYDEANAAAAWQQTRSFLEAHLGP